MADFTMELNEVIALTFGDSDDPLDFDQAYAPQTFKGMEYGKLPTVPDWNELGLGSYPIFDPTYRAILNGKIVDEYFTREIAGETVDEWTLMIRRRMDQIMPYYNQMYVSLDIPYEALSTMDIHSVGSANIESADSVSADSSSDTTTKSGGRVVSQETPQTMLQGNEDYATGATDSNSESEVGAAGTQTSQSESSTENNTDNRVTGYQGSASQLVVAYRNSLINIDTQLLGELKDCFMVILSNSDSYFKRGWFI